MAQPFRTATEQECALYRRFHAFAAPSSNTRFLRISVVQLAWKSLGPRDRATTLAAIEWPAASREAFL